MLRLVLVLIFLGVPAAGQSISVDLGTDGSITTTTLQLFALITVLSLAPGIAIMVTCFPFILTVFSILRQAIGLQQAPPNMLIVSLALFLTYYVMEPVFGQCTKMVLNCRLVQLSLMQLGDKFQNRLKRL